MSNTSSAGEPLRSRIQSILYDYVKAQSFSYSSGEKKAEEFFIGHFAQQSYFRNHPDHFGAFPIEQDPFHRAVCYAMVKGSGADTIVFIHHYDVVTVEDFKLLSPYAFTPDQLERELKNIIHTLPMEAREDLSSGDYLFGRGVCDMKGGGSVQMALLDEYSEKTDFKGNLIVIGVPDEENLSAGMRAAVLLLDQLQTQHELKYRLMINSEPHQRTDPETGVFSLGSIGKMMPFVYVRGSLAHAGKVYEGLNPVSIMSAIVRKTELNMDFSDSVNGEAAPPPTWLYLRDNKISYDVSMPLTMCGCLSVLTLNQTPPQVMEKVKMVCESAFDEVLADMNASYRQFCEASERPIQPLPWKTCVTDFGCLYKEAADSHGDDFKARYQEELNLLREKLQSGEMTIIACNFALVDFVCNYIDDLSPRVIFGLIPPYYPNAANLFISGLDEKISRIHETLNDFTMKTYGQSYTHEYFYTGISDLSYSSIQNSESIIQSLHDTMPFFGNLYEIPIAAIESISMPCINIGPWGKDFHKMTERVLKEDLYERTPAIIRYTIEQILG